MAGIVTGTRIWRIVWGEPSVKKYSGLIWIMALSAAAAIVFLKTELPLEKRVFGQVMLGLLNLIPGIITGSVYGMSLSLHKAGNYSGIGRIFSADLAGAALGSFIPAVFILPLIGVINTFILFCGINLATGLYLMARQGQS
jgi:hypothetical protein